MKEFLSKFTVGFLMAQFLPGFILVNSISIFLFYNDDYYKIDFIPFIDKYFYLIFNSYLLLITVIIFSIIFGLVIHGLHWIVLARLENNDDDFLTPIHERSWHKKPIFIQLLYMPFVMLFEIFLFLKTSNFKHLLMDENIPHFNSKCTDNYLLIQDFYLNFGQFYSHLSYSLLFSYPFICFLILNFSSGTLKPLIILLLIYLSISLLIIIVRIQLLTLFNAEEILKDKCSSINE